MLPNRVRFALSIAGSVIGVFLIMGSAGAQAQPRRGGGPAAAVARPAMPAPHAAAPAMARPAPPAFHAAPAPHRPAMAPRPGDGPDRRTPGPDRPADATRAAIAGATAGGPPGAARA